MSVAAAALLWLVIGFVLANLPFLTERRFLLITRGEKSLVFRLLELLVGYALTLALAFCSREPLVESRSRPGISTPSPS